MASAAGQLLIDYTESEKRSLKAIRAAYDAHVAGTISFDEMTARIAAIVAADDALRAELGLPKGQQ